MSSSYFRVSSTLSAKILVKMRHFSEISRKKKGKKNPPPLLIFIKCYAKPGVLCIEYRNIILINHHEGAIRCIDVKRSNFIQAGTKTFGVFWHTRIETSMYANESIILFSMVFANQSFFCFFFWSLYFSLCK